MTKLHALTVIAIGNIYIWAHNMASHSAWTYMNIHEHTWTYMNIQHTWTALRCRPNSTCKADGLMPSWGIASLARWMDGLFSSRHLASPPVWNHVGVTTIERLDQGHLHPKLEVQGLTCPGRESIPRLPRAPILLITNLLKEDILLNRYRNGTEAIKGRYLYKLSNEKNEGDACSFQWTI